MPVVLVLLLSLLSATTTAAAEPARTVTVEGQARVVASPDRATIRMGVEARAADVKTANQEVVATVRRMLQMTREIGIPDERVSTAAALVNPDYDWNPETRERRLLGYVVTRQLVIELHDLEQLGQVTESALKLGINQLDPPVLDTSRREAIEREALAEAALDARRRAQALAEALGADLGDVRTLQAGSSFSPPVPMARGMVLAAEADSGAETYQPGQITIRASVSASFDLVLP